MEKEEQFLKFSDVVIYQDDSFFKYNTDSILLAYFALKHLKKGNIIDLATGTIPIPLYLVLHTKQNINAIELQQEVCTLAKKTIKCNKLDNRINLICDDIKNMKKYFALNSFENVICNPPYFDSINYHKQSSNFSKSIARHDNSLYIEDILKTAKYLLNNNGCLFLIYRSEKIVELLSLLHTYHLEPKVIRMIYSNSSSPSKLFLIEARLNGNKGCKIEKPLFIYDKDNYSEEMIKIAGDDFNDSKEL